MLLGEDETVALIRLHSTNNGGTIGDAWGEFVQPELYTSKKHFTPGEWVFFSNNFAKTIEGFIREDGTCDFSGPFKRQHLSHCANDCEDFATLEEAMTRCWEIPEDC